MEHARFAKLTIDIALMGGLLNSIFGKSSPLSFQTGILLKVAGLLLTFLFWNLKERTMPYWYNFVRRAAELEETLGFSQYSNRPRVGGSAAYQYLKFLGASFVSINILFRQTKEFRAQLLEDERLRQYLEFLIHHHRETFLHTLRVCSLSIDLGLENNLDSSILMNLGYASLLHDIGKALIPKDLLAKTTGLDSLEQQIMREHVRLGFRLLDEFKPEIVKQIVVGHHEFSRSPYPRNGSERRPAPRGSESRRKLNPSVSQPIQILAISDIFDALVQPRAYKNAFTKEETEAVLRHEFTGNPDLIDQVLRRLNEI